MKVSEILTQSTKAFPSLEIVPPLRGLTKEELFSRVDNNELESEKITAPRYSYWHSVFRVFFRKKINIIVLAILAKCSFVCRAATHLRGIGNPLYN